MKNIFPSKTKIVISLSLFLLLLVFFIYLIIISTKVNLLYYILVIILMFHFIRILYFYFTNVRKIILDQDYLILEFSKKKQKIPYNTIKKVSKLKKSVLVSVTEYLMILYKDNSKKFFNVTILAFLNDLEESINYKLSGSNKNIKSKF